MAERRMFSKTIIDSDLFLDMPLTSQALYFHLGMRADDDGFVNSPKKIQRAIGATDDDIKLLIAKGFVIPFASGVVVIAHWKIHNYIRKDTYNETRYIQEKNQLIIYETGEYSLVSNTEPARIKNIDKTSTTRRRHVDEPSTQVSIGKESIGEYSIDKGSVGEERKEESKDSVEIPNTSSPIGADDVDMTIKYFFLRYLAYKGEAHEEVSPQKMEEIKANLDEAGATREFVDVYFGDDEHKGLCGESDCKIFHFASPTVLNLIEGRVNGSTY